MRLILTIIHLIIHIVFICLSSTSFAISWPIFLPPDKDLLFKLNYIDTNHCPAGQGKLINTPININKYLCKNYCPDNWEWIGNSDNNCHDLSDFNFKQYKITHYPDKNGINYSQINVEYGPKNSNRILFEYFLTTQPGEQWYCVILNQEMNLFSCANDTRKIIN